MATTMLEAINSYWKQQGVELKEIGDHIVELYKDGQFIARFSQTGVHIDNILKEIQIGKYDN